MFSDINAASKAPRFPDAPELVKGAGATLNGGFSLPDGPVLLVFNTLRGGEISQKDSRDNGRRRLDNPPVLNDVVLDEGIGCKAVGPKERETGRSDSWKKDSDSVINGVSPIPRTHTLAGEVVSIGLLPGGREAFGDVGHTGSLGVLGDSQLRDSRTKDFIGETAVISNPPTSKIILAYEEVGGKTGSWLGSRCHGGWRCRWWRRW